MKVHLVYINSGNSSSVEDFNKVSAADDSEDEEPMEVQREENGAATNGKDYTQEPGNDITYWALNWEIYKF